MLLIEYKGMQAHWDVPSFLWVSSDKDFEKVLNEAIPDEVRAVDAVFLKGGVEGVLRKYYKTIYGKDFKIVRIRTAYPRGKEDVVF